MINLLKTSCRVAGMLFVAGVLAAAQGKLARPGTVNYAEGQVTLDGQSIGVKQIGSAEVSPGHVLQTNDGKAEMLLTPGVFLRLSDHSAVKMVSPSLSNTRVELLKGEAMVEVEQIEKENHLDIKDHGANTIIKKKGIYEFNANRPSVAVYQGLAQVEQDDHSNQVGKGREVVLGENNSKLKTEKFNVKDAERNDDLYAWSKLRSEYMAEANMSMARNVFAYDPAWWYGTGWYWDPYFDTFAFLPGDGFLYSPFGFGFFSPAYWGAYGPYLGHRGFGYPRVFGRSGSGRGATIGRGAAVTRGPAGRAPLMRGGFGGSGMRGGFGGGGMRGGGMRGGGGRR